MSILGWGACIISGLLFLLLFLNIGLKGVIGDLTMDACAKMLGMCGIALALIALSRSI